MAKQTFTAGQVLTATQMNNLQANDYNWSTNAQTASYVLVAADAGKTVSMTNAGATTITVNTSLFTAGDTVRIINLGAGATTITAGTATVNSASSLALAQYQSGTLWFTSASAAIFSPDDKTVSAGLQYITGASFSAVSSLSLPTSTFTSTYRNYRLMLNITDMSATMTITGRLRTSGTDNTTANYYYSAWGWSLSGTGISGQNTAQTSLQVAVQDIGTYRYGCVNLDIMSPQLTERTILTGTSIGPGASGFPQYWTQNIFTGLFSSTTQFDSLSLICNTGNITGAYRVYGYSES